MRPTFSAFACVIEAPCTDQRSTEHFVNVEDTARFHVAAALNLDIRSERLFAFAAPYTWNDILRIMRSMDPLRPLPELFPNIGRDLSTVATRWGADLLAPWGLSDWTGLEQTVTSTINSLSDEMEHCRPSQSLRSRVLQTVNEHRPRLVFPLTTSSANQTAVC